MVVNIVNVVKMRRSWELQRDEEGARLEEKRERRKG